MVDEFERQSARNCEEIHAVVKAGLVLKRDLAFKRCKKSSKWILELLKLR